jgi:hypothetical protein
MVIPIVIRNQIMDDNRDWDAEAERNDYEKQFA